MAYVIAMVENLLLIMVLPWMFNDAARDLVTRVDNRGMFSIPFCRSLAVACGGVLAIATAVLAGLASEISASSLWSISGFWHSGFLLDIVERYVQGVWSASSRPAATNSLVFAQMLFASAILLTAINLCIALMGWRSPAALRGVIAHCAISLSVWGTLTIRGLAALWILHWLNFWAFLILLVVLELRRHEEVSTRLSF
jgi:hypothetical protein